MDIISPTQVQKQRLLGQYISNFNSSSDDHKNDPRYKTELCKGFSAKGICVYGDKCLFAHGRKELIDKNLNQKFKMKKCDKFYDIGYCSYGSRCNFKHDERNLGLMSRSFYSYKLLIFNVDQNLSNNLNVNINNRSTSASMCLNNKLNEDNIRIMDKSRFSNPKLGILKDNENLSMIISFISFSTNHSSFVERGSHSKYPNSKRLKVFMDISKTFSSKSIYEIYSSNFYECKKNDAFE